MPLWHIASSRSRQLVSSAGALLVGMTLPSSGFARDSESPVSRVTICDRGAPEIAKRLKSELALLHVEVSVSHAADCAAEVPSDTRAIVITRRDRVSIRYAGRQHDEELVVEPRPDATADITALSTVEMLRARLIHRSSEQVPPASASPEGSEHRDTSASSPRWSAEVGPTLFVPGNALPASLGVQAQLGFELGRSVVVGLHGSASLASTEYPVDGGTMSYQIRTAAIMAQYRIPFVDGSLELRPSVGLGLAQGHSVAVAESKNFLDTETNRWAALGLVMLEFAWNPLPHWSLLADAGFVTMSPGMVFEGSARDPSVGGNSSPDRSSELGRFGAVASCGIRAYW